MKMDDIDTDYETVKIGKVGTTYPLTGAILFKDEKVEFLMSGFSSEVVRFISGFLEGKRRIHLPYIDLWSKFVKKTR
jgi:hypothetical protein